MPDYNLVPVEHDPFDEMGLKEAWQKGRFLQTLGHQLGQTDFAKGMKNMLTLPHDVMTGEANLATPEGKQRGVEMAFNMMGGGRAPKEAVGSGWGPLLDYINKNPNDLETGSAFNNIKLAILHSAENQNILPTAAASILSKDMPAFKALTYYNTAKILESHPLAPKSEALAKRGPNWLSDTVAQHLAAPPLYTWDNMHQHPALQGLDSSWEDEIGASQQSIGSQLLQTLAMGKYKTPQAAVNDWWDHGFISQDAKNSSTYTEPVKAIQKYIDENGSAHLAINKPVETTAGKGGVTLAKSAAPLIAETKTSSPYEPPPERTSIADALYPINWLDMHSTAYRPIERAQGEYANRLQQAQQALGFNPNLMLFHGSYKGLPYEHAPGVNILAPEWEGEYNPQLGPLNAFADPMKVKHNEQGLFFSDSPDIAASYAGNDVYHPIQTIPVLANPKNTLAVDWKNAHGSESYSGDTMNAIIRAAQKRDADMLVVHGMGDVGGMQTQYVALKNNILRSPFAEFNPEKASSPVLTNFGSPMFIPVDHDPFEKEQK